MSLIDGRGRLFGLVNLVDLAIAVTAIAALGVGAAAYRVFDIPAPVLERVEPAEVPISSDTPIVLIGHHLRHYLRAFVPRSDAPFAVIPSQPDGPVATVLSVTEDRMALSSAKLPAGVYDVYLFDDTKQVAHIARAFTIVPPRWPRGLLDVTMYAYLPLAAPGTVKAGDRDVIRVKDPALAGIGEAEVIATRLTSETTDDQQVAFGEYRKGDHYAWVSRAGKRAVVAVTLRVPVVQVAPPVWEYKHRPVRVGERFEFESPKYLLEGPIVSIGEVQPWR